MSTGAERDGREELLVGRAVTVVHVLGEGDQVVDDTGGAKRARVGDRVFSSGGGCSNAGEEDRHGRWPIMHSCLRFSFVKGEPGLSRRTLGSGGGGLWSGRLQLDRGRRHDRHKKKAKDVNNYLQRYLI